MTMVGRAAAAVWEFVVGDDWVTAVGVAVAIAAAAALQGAGVAAWWLEPLAVLVLLGASLRRAVWTERAQPIGQAGQGKGGGG